jgi:uncharacterized caspase-like protein
LRYADRDAQQLFELLKTPSGGGFEPDHIRTLLNSEATTTNISRALRGFLQRPARQDIVLIYFACHGAPDLQRPRNVYLLTHDTDPNDIAGTALPMREIDASLRDNLLAERVIIMADTCHSAALGTGSRGVNANAAVHQYLKAVSRSKSGTALLTSADASEAAEEHERWGGGHGVFTHFVLEGMRGGADRDQDGVVGVGELFEYVREHVIQETSGRQHPNIGTTQFDRLLPVSIPGGELAELHLDAARHLYKLGWWLDDTRRFAAARRQLAEVDRLSPAQGRSKPGHLRQLALTLEALGEYQRARQVFERAQNEGDTSPDVALNLAVLRARSGDRALAAEMLTKAVHDGDLDDYVAWAGEYANWLRHVQKSTRRALLIGINAYSNLSAPNLQGCANDVGAMKEVLLNTFEFQEHNITVLIDDAATRERVLGAFEDLRRAALPDDTVIVFFSGNSLTGESPGFLLLHDTDQPAATGSQLTGRIGGRQLHNLMNGIRAEHKALFLDTDANDAFIDLARRYGGYALFLASNGSSAFEYAFDGTRRFGAFTYALTLELAAVGMRSATFGDIADPVARRVTSRFATQSPLFVGSSQQTIIADADQHLIAFDFSRSRNYRQLTLDDVRQHYARSQELCQAPFSSMHASFGLALLAKHDYSGATAALRTAIEQRGEPFSEALLALSCALIGKEDFLGAMDTVRQYDSAISTTASSPLVQDVEMRLRSPLLPPQARASGCYRQLFPSGCPVNTRSGERRNRLKASALCQVRLPGRGCLGAIR